MRSLLAFTKPTALSHPLMKYPPHVVESLLLFSALAMLPLLNQYPFVDAWLTAKLMAMIVYILVGGVALHRCKTHSSRTFFVLLALSLFIYIIGVAVFRDSLSWFAH